MDSLYNKLEIPEEKRYVSVSEDEGEFLYNFIRSHKINRTLEIGLAYGCSAAYIIAATQQEHIAIDPYQEKLYQNQGLKNIDALGMSDKLRFIEGLSCYALPQLIGQQTRIDFAFIDGDHRFDHKFVDFFFVDRLLEWGGYIVFDDYWMDPIKLTASWISTNRKNYRRVECPQPHFVVFRKTSVIDHRQWNHFEDFSIK